MFTALAFGLSVSAKVMAQVPNYVPTNGLVGWWPFNGNANDESGNGNNGTVNGATLTSDRFGNSNNSYSFNGSTNFIEVPQSSSLLLTNDYSIAAWINIPDYSTSNSGDPMSVVVGKAAQNAWSSGYNLVAVEGNNSQNKFGGNNLLSSTVTPTNQWVHIVYTYDGSIVKLFLNGVLNNSVSIQFNLQNISPTSLFFGKEFNSTWSNRYFKGKADDIGIWDKALTTQEVSDLYSAVSCYNNLTITPSTNTQNIGGTANFVASTSDPTPTISWQSDFGQGFQTLTDYGNYSGANTNALSISNMQLANHNQPIRAISTSGNCVDTSNVATIQITDTCITNVTVYDTLLTTVTDTLIINTMLGLPAPNNENTILIYPNPASDHITIDNGNYTAMSGYSIKIENNAGQQVFQSLINQAQFYVDLSTWSGNGLYFVHLIDAQGNTVTVRKIVLQ